MPKRIAIVGAGALGGYVGGNLAHLGHDVTLIDPWPQHVETIRARGLELDGLTPEEKFTARPKILHLMEVQSLMKTPIDVAMVAVKSYDTLWATALIAPYLSERGFVVSLQNCMNEETIAGVVGWGRVVGAIAAMISVDLYEAGRIRRPRRKAATSTPCSASASRTAASRRASRSWSNGSAASTARRPRPISGANAGRSWCRT